MRCGTQFSRRPREEARITPFTDAGRRPSCCRSGGAERGAEQAARPLWALPVRCCLAGNRRCMVVAHLEVSSEQVSSRAGTGRPRQCEARAGQPVATGSPPPFRCSCTFLVAGVGWELVRTARWPPRGPRAPGQQPRGLRLLRRELEGRAGRVWRSRLRVFASTGRPGARVLVAGLENLLSSKPFSWGHCHRSHSATVPQWAGARSAELSSECEPPGPRAARPAPSQAMLSQPRLPTRPPLSGPLGSRAEAHTARWLRSRSR